MSEQKNDALNPVSLVGSIFKFSIATWVNAALYLVTLILATYVFGAYSGIYGLYNLFFTAASTIMPLAMLGLDSAYIRFYHEPPAGIGNARQLAAACLSISIAAMAGLSLVLCLIFPRQISVLFFEGDTDMSRYVVLLCVNAFLLLVTRYFNITYRMQQNVKMYTIQNILLNIFTRMFFLAGMLVSPTLDMVVGFAVGGLALFSLTFFLLQRRSMLPEKPQFKLRDCAPLMRYGLPLVPSSIIQYFNPLISSIYVNAVLGSAELGIFSFMSNVSLALGVIQGGFATFWSAFIFGNYKTEQRRIRRVHDYLTFIMLSLMAALIAAQPLIFSIFGESFRAGMPIFGLMLYAPMLLIISETTVYGVEIAKKTIYNSIATAIHVGSNALLCIWLVPRLGMVGAAISLAVSGLLMFCFRTAAAQSFYKSMDRPTRTAVSLTLMAALCAISYLFAARAVLVSLAGLALLGFYMVLYRNELRRCFAIAGDVLHSLTNRKKADE